MVGKIVEERRKGMNFTDEKAPIIDAVDLLLRDSSESSETQRLPLDFISQHLLEMMVPGEETMPTAMTLAVKFLSDNPVVLQNLMEENMELKRRKTDSCEDYTWTDYMSLQFTQNVISETLRMANIINGVWRKALKDVEIKGYSIPQGWCVLTSFISVHMDEDNYENPYKFNPWRWEKIAATVSNNCLTPFGGGQRLCPGLELSRLELSIFLHYLVTTYRWVAQQDEIVYFPTVKMKRKLPITVTPISC
uniref:3-epi-6-deoxocathasterone 23-monooxygenase n=1 Tax=Fagus sylvatica TaxID=28930 RepID=A0A2N9GR18_FAGSY